MKRDEEEEWYWKLKSSITGWICWKIKTNFNCYNTDTTHIRNRCQMNPSHLLMVGYSWHSISPSLALSHIVKITSLKISASLFLSKTSESINLSQCFTFIANLSHQVHFPFITQLMLWFRITAFFCIVIASFIMSHSVMSGRNREPAFKPQSPGLSFLWPSLLQLHVQLLHPTRCQHILKSMFQNLAGYKCQLTYQAA